MVGTGASTENRRAREIVREAVQGVEPWDDIEMDDKEDVLSWIDSGAPLFRVRKPDVPPQHLVSYCVVLDEVSRKLLLVHHIKAQLWLPPGGHVEPDEDPTATAEREAAEELGIRPVFTRRCGRSPLFLTKTVTVGLTAGHTDVSLVARGCLVARGY